MSAEITWLIVFVVGFIWYLSHQAGRLDRLHHRIELASTSLDGHLNRRAGIAAELVSLGFLDPASEAYLMQSAHDVLAGADLPDPERLSDESELTEALADAFEDEEDVLEFRTDAAINLLLDELIAVCTRINYAKRSYADAVRDCLTLHDQTLVRLFRLAGRARRPTMIEFDDRIPSGFTR